MVGALTGMLPNILPENPGHGAGVRVSKGWTQI